MSDDTHVTDVGGLVHKGPNLVCIAGFVVSVTHDARWAGIVYSPTVKLLRGGHTRQQPRQHTKIARERVRTPWWGIFTGIMIQRRVGSRASRAERLCGRRKERAASQLGSPGPQTLARGFVSKFLLSLHRAYRSTSGQAQRDLKPRATRIVFWAQYRPSMVAYGGQLDTASWQSTRVRERAACVCCVCGEVGRDCVHRRVSHRRAKHTRYTLHWASSMTTLDST